MPVISSVTQQANREYMQAGVCFNCGDPVDRGGFVCPTCNAEFSLSLTNEIEYERARELLDAIKREANIEELYPERQAVEA